MCMPLGQRLELGRCAPASPFCSNGTRCSWYEIFLATMPIDWPPRFVVQCEVSLSPGVMFCANTNLPSYTRPACFKCCQAVVKWLVRTRC